jgi:predicted transglutaminase-like cysteine proteinase
MARASKALAKGPVAACCAAETTLNPWKDYSKTFRWILVQLASILLLVLVWCSSSRADEYASVPHNVIESRASTTIENQGIERAREKGRQSLILSRLMPAQNDHEEQRAIQSSEPLLEALTEDISAKWADLQARIQLEQEALAACRAGSINCPAAARRFLHIVELGRQRQGRARLAEINRAVNFSIRPVSDWAQYGVADFWSAPLATLNAGKGDCEDYAVLKYEALREAGIAPENLRLLLVYYPRRRTNHAVVAVHVDEEWLILDNSTLIMANSSDVRHYRPLFVLDHRGIGVFGFGGVGDGLQTRPADPSALEPAPQDPRWRLRSARNMLAPSLQNRTSKGIRLTIYPVEFQRRLEQKWARRIDQIIAVTRNATPPRDPNDDDDYEDEDEEDKDQAAARA